jgi:hypothetical protein
MGVVDLAVDEAGRPVACKRLLLHGSAHDMHRARQRIRREAAALARLDHPNIVPLLEVVDDGDDVVLVLPYLSGGTLADQVRHHGPLTPGQVDGIADALMGALASAHQHGIVHRDIKPANVLFDEHGRPYLTDFGVATLRDSTGGLTASGVVVGTPEFMAPEQARGEDVGPPADVFSLGATLLYAATGHPPYGRGEPGVVLQRAARGRLAPLPSTLDRGLRRRLQPTLSRSPTRRPSAAQAAAGRRSGPAHSAGGADSAQTVAEADAGPGGTRIGAPATPRRRPRRRTLAVTAAVVVALGAIVAVGLAANRSDGGLAAPPSTLDPSEPCTDLPYQPCGFAPAPGTDGTECLPRRADYDGDASTGCEAVSDDVAGTPFVERIEANLVPADGFDEYPMRVRHSFNLFCDNELVVTLVAPRGGAMRLEVLDETELLGSAVSADAEPAEVRLGQPDCFANVNLDLIARVSWEGERRTAGNYVLTREGRW